MALISAFLFVDLAWISLLFVGLHGFLCFLLLGIDFSVFFLIWCGFVCFLWDGMDFCVSW